MIESKFKAERSYRSPTQRIRITMDYQGARRQFFVGAGWDDEISIWHDDSGVYVLSMNRGLGYVGIEVFSLDGDELTTDMSQSHFVDKDYELRELFQRVEDSFGCSELEEEDQEEFSYDELDRGALVRELLKHIN